MSGDDKKSGIMRPIIIGVSTTVLTAAALSYLGLEKKSSPDVKAQPAVSTTETELRQRQAELEEKIRQLSEKELTRRQDDLDSKMRQYEKKFKEADYQVEDTPQQQSSLPNIGGTWRDPNTQASYLIEQHSDQFTIKEFSAGIVSAVGQGTIVGQSGSFSYSTILGTYGTGRIIVGENAGYLSCVFTDAISQMTLSINLYR